MAGKKKTAVSSSTDSSSGDSSSAASSSDDDGSGSNSSDSSSSSSDSEDSSTTNRSSGQVNKAKKSKKSDQKMTQMSKTKLSPPTVKKKQKNFTEDDDDDDDDDKMAEKKKLQVKRKNNVRPKVSATLLTAAVKSTTTSCQKVASQTVNNKSSSSKKSKSIFSPENSSNDDDDEQQQQHGEKSSKCQKKKRRKSTSTTTSSTTTTTTTSSSVNTSTTSNSSDSNSSDNDSNKMSTTMTQMSKKRCQEIKTNNNKNDSSTKQQKNDDSSSTTPSSNNVKLTTTTKKPVKKLTRQQTQQSNNEQRKTSTTSKKIKKKNTDNSGAIEESDNNKFALKQHHVVSKSPVKRQTTQLVNNQQLSTIQQTTNSNSSSNKQQTTTTTTKKDSSAVKQLQLSKATSSNCQKKVTKCPLDQCDSSGHLTGRSDDRRHFTLEACPLYHNLTHAQCKFEAVERKKREEMRKRALDTFNSTRITSEQRNYLTHVKMLRQVTPSQLAQQQQQQQTENLVLLQNNGKIQTTATTLQQQQQQQKMTATEPDLKNFVADYDLKLFRDAQALSSETIEEALRNAYAMTHCTKVGTKLIEMGRHEMEVWYQSPYPEDYARLPKLYICQFCLRYMKSVTILERHVIKCVWRHPPGDEVYRKDKVSVWEVDGKKYKQYCQNLCLLAKFFLDHKTLYYDVEPFLFYIMTVNDSDGCHTIGYFSKEKNSFLNYNVSCILTLPPYQRQGYGRLLIDFSYLLTRVEGKIGSPEKPLSDLGLISYRSYWKDVLLNYLCARAGTTLSVKDISQEMAIHSYDIVSTLQALGMMKYWKGKHIILKKQDVLDEYQERVKRRCQQFKEIDPTCLKWRPPTYCQNQTPP